MSNHVPAPTGDPTETFEGFITACEPRLRHACVASLGLERGREATAEAVAYAWEHWDVIRYMANPVGYLYRVGQSRTRHRRRPRLHPTVPSGGAPEYEPALERALDRLSAAQRQAVLLVHGFGWSLQEVADLNGVAKGTVQTHLERAMKRIRSTMGVEL